MREKLAHLDTNVEAEPVGHRAIGGDAAVDDLRCEADAVKEDQDKGDGRATPMAGQGLVGRFDIGVLFGASIRGCVAARGAWALSHPGHGDEPFARVLPSSV